MNFTNIKFNLFMIELFFREIFGMDTDKRISKKLDDMNVDELLCEINKLLQDLEIKEKECLLKK